MYLESDGQACNPWCRPNAASPWALEVLFEESDGDDWLYRRNLALRRPLASLTSLHDGVPYLAVEVALLYKALRHEIDRNAADFEACLPRLNPDQRGWLRTALLAAHPGNPWIDRLAPLKTTVDS
jgi:hypothetical protein